MKKIATIKVSFGLLSFDVGVYGLRSRQDTLKFSGLSKCCRKPVGLKKYCKSCNTIGEWKTEFKGFKTGKDTYVELSVDELNTIAKLDSKIEILYFDKIGNIPINNLDKPYFLEGLNPISNKIYNILNDNLVELGKVAVCKCVMKGNEHFAILKHDRNGLAIQYLERTTNLVIDIPKVEYSKAEKEQFKDLINNNTKVFNFDELKNVYVDNVKELIENKANGKAIKVMSKVSKELDNTQLLDTLKQMNNKKVEVVEKVEIKK